MTPRLPNGATVRAVLSVYHALCKAAQPTRRKMSLLALGFGTVDALKPLLDQNISGRAILENHTFAPLLWAIQSQHGAEEMFNTMLVPPKPVPKGLMQLKAVKNVRRCPICVQEDMRTGFAFSRVSHQIPTILSCIEHGVPLEEDCDGCGKPFAPIEMHPGSHRNELISTCKSCEGHIGRSLDVKTSPGYSAYTSLVAMALEGDAPMLAAPHRFTLIEHAAQTAKRLKIVPLNEFCKFWECSTPNEAAALSGIEAAHLKRCFALRMFPFDVSLAISTVSLATHILSKAKIEYVGDFCPLPEWLSVDRDDALSHALVTAAATWGIPIHAAAKLAKGIDTTSVRSVLRLPPSLLESFIDSLSEQQRIELQARQTTTKSTRTLHRKAPEEFRALKRADALAMVHVRPNDEHKKTGRISRTALEKHAHNLYAWLYANDKAWLDFHFPVVRSSAPSWHPASESPSVRHAIAALQGGNFSSLSDLRIRCHNLFNWLSKNYPDVLRKCGRTKASGIGSNLSEVIRESKRAALLRIIKSHKAGTLGLPSSTHIRKVIEVENSSLRKWFLENDHAWFCQQVPALRPRTAWRTIEEVVMKLIEIDQDTRMLAPAFI